MDNIKLLYIDLFCGAGGTSSGVEYAKLYGNKCAKVVACVNHDKNAILSHAANHPDVMHFTEDIRTLELSPMLEHLNKMKAKHPGAHVVLWASLECTNFSRAKGGMPRDADSRTLAEHLFRYIETLQPDYIQIENVEEFMCWGDLDENGKPVSRDKGTSYLRWVRNVREYGYDFDWRILNAADFGAYTSRKRFKEARKKRRDNYVVIQRKRYYPKRIGREVDCKVDCPLYKHCERGTKSICVVLNSPYDDTIMTTDDDD